MNDKETSYQDDMIQPYHLNKYTTYFMNLRRYGMALLLLTAYLL